MAMISTVGGRDILTLEAGEEIAVGFQEVHQDLVDQSMSFDEPETIQMTVDEVTDQTIRGVDEDTEYVIPVSSHKKTNTGPRPWIRTVLPSCRRVQA
jgi:hypothetical protein